MPRKLANKLEHKFTPDEINCMEEEFHKKISMLRMLKREMKGRCHSK